MSKRKRSEQLELGPALNPGVPSSVFRSALHELEARIAAGCEVRAQDQAERLAQMDAQDAAEVEAAQAQPEAPEPSREGETELQRAERVLATISETYLDQYPMLRSVLGCEIRQLQGLGPLRSGTGKWRAG